MPTTAQDRNTMISYLMWRVMTGRHTNINYSFLVIGHMKFSPDWCFGLFKWLFKRTKVSSMAEIADVVEKSAVCNWAQFVHTEVVPTYDWASFLLPHCTKVPNIKRYHHFRFSSSSPGIVFAKEHTDTPEVELPLLRNNWGPCRNELPPQIQPKGLSDERQWYLYKWICLFCSDEQLDTVTPRSYKANPKRRRTPATEE